MLRAEQLKAGPKLPQQKGCKGDQGPGCVGIGVTGRREGPAEVGQAGRLSLCQMGGRPR